MCVFDRLDKMTVYTVYMYVLHDCSSCFAGRMYVVGGSDGQSSLTSVEIYDFESRTWTHGPNMNIARANVALAVVGQRLYAVGGFSGKHFLNSSEFLAKDLKEWSTFAPRLASSLSGSESSTESDAPVSDVESYSNDALVTSARNGHGDVTTPLPRMAGDSKVAADVVENGECKGTMNGVGGDAGNDDVMSRGDVSAPNCESDSNAANNVIENTAKLKAGASAMKTDVTEKVPVKTCDYFRNTLDNDGPGLCQNASMHPAAESVVNGCHDDVSASSDTVNGYS